MGFENSFDNPPQETPDTKENKSTGPPPLPEYLKQEILEQRSRKKERTAEGLYEIGRFAVGENRFLAIRRETEEALPTTKLHVVIENSDGNPVFDFSQFAPLEESWGGFSRDIDRRTGRESISLNSELMAADPRDVMALLHEIGHTLTTKSLKENDPEELQRREIGYKSFTRSIRHDRKQTLPGAIELTFNEERDAWAKGIRLARRIKEEHGADLFQFFKTPDEFFAWMRLTALRSYEIEAEKRGMVAISGDARVQDWIKKNPGAVGALGKRSHILREDLLWKTAREKERTEFIEYLKETYPDLYSEVEDISMENPGKSES